MSQVFKKKTNLDILSKILETIGLKNLRDEFSFRKKDFVYHETVKKIKDIKSDLEEFYFPCKAKIYLENIDEHKVVTIFRHFLKTFDYNVISREKYLHGEKYIEYTFISNRRISKPNDRVIIFAN
jgi:hypothetical protein